MSMQPVLTLRELTFEWPNGRTVLDCVDGTINEGRTGLVGRNGAGKSTLLRLVAGELQPTSGRIEVTGPVGYLPQLLTLREEMTVADLLGISGVRSAIRSVERGEVTQQNLDVIGEDWDIEARAAAALHPIGFSADHLERPVGALSGGEAILIAITALSLRRTPITLLDEPTNNLDPATRAKLATMVDRWPGTLVVVSHDLDLLERMDSTVEIQEGRLETFGGPYSEWQRYRAQEQAAAIQAVRSAEQALKAEKRQRLEAEMKLAQRARVAKHTQANAGIPRILAGNRASKAQGAAGAMRSTMEARVTAAQAMVDEAGARVRDELHITLNLPDPNLPAGRRVLEIGDDAGLIVVQGPERVALVGPNGSGKTTLVEQIVRGTRPLPGRPSGRLHTDRFGYLPQRLDGLEEGKSAIANVRRAAPTAPEGTIRNQLARMLLRGDSADRPVCTLSGGERFRVSLARLLLREPTPQLLILDEPTNNLDIASVDQLVEALARYRGAVLIVSHDYRFLARVGVATVIELDSDGRLTQRRELR